MFSNKSLAGILLAGEFLFWAKIIATPEFNFI